MKLTGMQRNHLQALLVQRREGVRVLQSIAQGRVLFAAHLMLATGGAFYLTQSHGWQLIGAALVGLAAGSYIRIVRLTIAAKQVWPSTSAVIDWEKLEAMLKDDAQNG